MGIEPVRGLRDAVLKELSTLVSYKMRIFLIFAAIEVYCFPAIVAAGAVQVALGFLFGLAVLVISERAFVKWLGRGDSAPVGNQPDGES